MSINRDRKIVGDVQDRGALKWTTLMLPEHIRMLREWKEEDNRVPKPELDDFDLQFLQENIDIAIKRKCEVEIQTWKGDRYHYYLGTIIEADSRNSFIVYTDSSGKKRLPITELVAVNTLD